MATYKWSSGPLDDPNSYSPLYGAPPLNGNLPTTTDTVEFPAGELTGALDIGQATFLGNTVLSGFIKAVDGVFLEAGSSLNITTDGKLTAGAEFFDSPSGNSIQTGGTNTVTDTFQIDSGSYELDAGALNAQINEFIGTNPSASFLQKGGTHTVTGELFVGSDGIGSYTLTGGVDAILKAGGEIIGDGSSSTFVQSGGSNTIFGHLDLGIEDIGNLGTGSYTLSGTGELIVGSSQVSQGILLGVDTGGTGHFEQSGGALTDFGFLTVGYAGGTGIFEMTAASSQAAQATVTGLTTVNSGSLISVSAGALTLENGLSVLGTGEFYIVTGGKVTIDGNFNVNETPGLPSAIYIDGADGADSSLVSSLVMNSSATAPGDLILTGTLLVSHGAIASGIGNANVTSHNVNSLASIDVGDSPLFGINNPGTSLSHFSAGNMTLGSSGLFVGQNGYADIGVTLTLNATFLTTLDGSPIGGVVGVLPGGSLEIGGPGTAAPDTVTIGSTGSLLGHGAVLATTIVNNGVVAAQNGLLFLGGNLGGNVTGNGVANIGDHSTLEIGGSFSSTGTVSFTVDGSGLLSTTGTGTLILDQPTDSNQQQTFNGTITNLAVGDTIELKNITVIGQQILYKSDGTHVLDIGGTDSSGTAVHLDYQISGPGNLNIDHFAVTSANGTSSLAFTQYGSVTTYVLDNNGMALLGEVWGDPTTAQKPSDNVTVYIENGQYVNSSHMHGYNLSYVEGDFPDFQMASGTINNNHVAGNETFTPSKTSDLIQTSSQASDYLNWVEDPLHPDPVGVLHHNADIAYQHAGSDSVTTVTDGSGHAISLKIVQGTGYQLSTTSGGITVAASYDSTGVLKVYGFVYANGSETDIVTASSGIWVENNYGPDGGFTGSISESIEGAIASTQQLVNQLGITEPLLAEITDGNLAKNLPSTLAVNPVPILGDVNSSGSPVNPPPTGGAVPSLSTVAGVISHNGSAIVATGGGNLIGNAAGTLIGQDGAGLISHDGGSVISHNGSAFKSIAGPGGYLANALVFADANGDGVLDNGEAWAYTDANGNFTLNGGSGPLVVTGGTDTSTGLPFTGTLSAPIGSTDISALTTLANDLTQRTGNIDGSITQVQAALGLSGQIDVTTMDPITGTQNGDSTSAAVYVDMAKVMDTVELISAAFAGIGASGSTAGNDVFSSMVDMIVNNGFLNVSNKATDVALINAVASTLGINASAIVDSVATHIAASNQLLDQYLVADGSGPKLVNDIVTVETSAQGGVPLSVSSLTAATDNHAAVVNAGHVVTVTMNLSEAVTVTGVPTLQLNDNEVAAYTFGSGSNTLSFSYVAQTGDNVADLHVTGLNLPTGASIADGSGGSLAGSVTSDLGIQVDTVTVPLTSVQQQILGLYGVLYTRAADAGGLSYWTGVVGQQPDGAGVTVADGASTAITINDATVLGQLFVSTESSYFNQVYGAMSDSAFITTLYGTIGGNTIGIAPGITYWSGVLQALETAGQSQQAARAGIVGEIVQAMIDYNINIRPAGYTDAEWLAAQQRQETTDNKVAVSLAYSNASQQPGGTILDAVTVTDAAFLAATRVIEGVTYNGTTADAAISNILHAVALQDLTQIQPVGVVSGGLMG
jgi:hypothetical protein